MVDENKKLNILIAFPYMQQNVATLSGSQDVIRFVLDSGAFTAWKAKKEIDLDEYCRFIESLPFKPWRYFTLDVIGDPHRTIKNYETMLKRGFKPIPIFTRGESISVLEDYYKTSDVVGIGGLVGTPNNKGFVKGIMRHVKDRRVHWLGFTSVPFVKYYRPYMCDSSSWSSAIRYGQIKFYIGGGKSIIINKKNVFSSGIKNILESYNMDILSAFKKDAWRNKPNSFINNCSINSAIRISNDFQKEFETYCFNALATKDQIIQFVDEYKRIGGSL